jgi:hypothetical protein
VRRAAAFEGLERLLDGKVQPSYRAPCCSPRSHSQSAAGWGRRAMVRHVCPPWGAEDRGRWSRFLGLRAVSRVGKGGKGPGCGAGFGHLAL